MTADADSTLDSILSYAEELGYTEYKLSKDKYKVKIPILNAKGQKVELKVELFKVDHEKICADFMKLDGDYPTFVEEFNAIRNYLSGSADDQIENTASETV